MTSHSTAARAASSAVTTIPTTTRRRALIAMACVPAAAIGAAPLPSWPAAPSIDRTKWDRKQAELAEIKRDHVRIAALYDAAEAGATGGSEEFDGLDHEWMANGNAQTKAERELMALPAPDAEALAWKIEHLLAIDHTDATTAWEADYLGTTMADVRRLLRGEG